MRVAGADDDADVGGVADEAGHRGEAHRPGAEHRDDRRVGARHGGGPGGHERGVDAAGQRLDEHGPLVAHALGQAVQLGLVGHELLGPAAPRRAAEPGLDAGFEDSGGEVGVVVAVARRGAGERRREAAGLVAEHRLQHHASAVLQLADDLVAGQNGKLTQSSKYVEAPPSIIDRSEPQIPASRVRT